MSCHDFNPGIENFCSVPDDFVNAMQIVQMATYFGMKKAELKKVKNIALLEEKLRLLHLPWWGFSSWLYAHSLRQRFEAIIAAKDVIHLFAVVFEADNIGLVVEHIEEKLIT